MFEKSIDLFWHLIGPFQFMTMSASYFPITVFSLLKSLEFGTLLSPPALKEAWFARFWSVVGPEIRRGCSPELASLLHSAQGVVLDIGPGSGQWVDLFDKEKVTKIYGVEPNRDHHESLKKKVKAAGLADIYVIVPVGVEDLGEGWVTEESVDTVVTVLCLCSVPSPKEMIAHLYRYIKHGGQWILHEHVVTPHGGWIAKYQAMVDLFWPHFLGGCSITRDTQKYLREAGEWSKFDLKQPPLEPSYQVVPHLMGVLTK